MKKTIRDSKIIVVGDNSKWAEAHLSSSYSEFVILQVENARNADVRNLIVEYITIKDYEKHMNAEWEE